MYCAMLVNGPINNDASNKKPAILSLRYLLTKAADNEDYAKDYLAKKFGGLQNSAIIQKLVKSVNREPIDFMRKKPQEFLAAYLRMD